MIVGRPLLGKATRPQQHSSGMVFHSGVLKWACHGENHKDPQQTPRGIKRFSFFSEKEPAFGDRPGGGSRLPNALGGLIQHGDDRCW